MIKKCRIQLNAANCCHIFEDCSDDNWFVLILFDVSRVITLLTQRLIGFYEQCFCMRCVHGVGSKNMRNL